MTLRPEGTASAMRCVIEKRLIQQSPVQKLYYLSPMFRYERPQAGRYRQHHQLGVEAIGNAAPEQDVEIIDLLYSLYQRLGLKNISVFMNSVGQEECRKRYRDALMEYLRPHLDSLSSDSKNRFEVNPLRILDSKDEKDRAIIENAPVILDFLNEECTTHFEAVCSGLDALKIPYKIDSRLVRGLDYYTKTVFEMVSGDLGAQNTVGAGGRYDGLIRSLGGPDTPAVGFGTGMERIIQTMLAQEVSFPNVDGPACFLVPLGARAINTCQMLLQNLRHQHIPVEMDFSGKKLKNILRYADDIGAKYVVVIGDQELDSGVVEMKDMAARTAKKVPLETLSQELIR